MEPLSILDWRTLVFLIPVVFAALLALGAALGVGSVEAGHGPEAGGGAEGHGAHEARHGGLPLALGELPLTVGLMLVSFLFGGIGLIVGPLVRAVLPGAPVVGGLVAVGVALVGAVVVSGRLARVVARRAPLFESESIRRADLVGAGGKLVVAASATARGLAQVRDRRGNLHQVPCHTERGEPDLPAGSEVLVVHYDETSGTFLVTASLLT